MQNTAVQMKTSGAKSNAVESSSPISRKKDQSEFVDPFMQIIMSMISQPQDLNSQQTENTTSTVSALSSDQLGELAALMQNLQSGMTEAPNLTTTSESNAAAILNAIAQAIAKTTEVTAPVTTAQTAAETNLASQISSLLSESTNNSGTVTISPEVLDKLTTLMGFPRKEELQTVLKTVGITVESSNPISAQADFTKAVVKAKEMLPDKLDEQGSSSDEIDVDKIQNELSKSNGTTAFELSLQKASGTSEAPILDQLKDGIKQNISLGKSEFTIKLKPESLGEITVKLIEEAGKTTISITTANAQTAKLINSDLNALKDAVASMNVEVKNAVVQTNETANSSMHQFDMSGQQFAGQQFAGQQSFYQMAQTTFQQSDKQNSEETLAALQGAYVPTASSDRLDAYI